MFNCYSKPGTRIVFNSNPSCADVPIVVPEPTEDGNVRNKVIYQPKSNKSIFDGIHYSAEEMSLRAKLNLGVKMTYVGNVNIENDPASVQRNMLRVEQSINEKISELEKEQETPKDE